MYRRTLTIAIKGTMWNACNMMGKQAKFTSKGWNDYWGLKAVTEILIHHVYKELCVNLRIGQNENLKKKSLDI